MTPRSDLVLFPAGQAVPAGWWLETVVPWADAQSDAQSVRVGAARYAALEAAWREMGADTLELTRARRYLETRLGELLGPAEMGVNQHSEPSHACEGSLGKDDRSRFRVLAAHKPLVVELLAAAVDADNLSRAALLRAVTPGAPSVVQSSESNEWYTPAVYVDAARAVMGGIDLDPASCAEANETVQAEKFYDLADDGLSHDWKGAVWLNPPYGRLGGAFVARMVEAHAAGDIVAAVCLVNAHCTDTTWFQLLWDHTLCFTDHRVNFVSPESRASGSTHGSAFAYLGAEPAVFSREFARFGAVVRRYRP